jgi:hypothetical protein
MGIPLFIASSLLIIYMNWLIVNPLIDEGSPCLTDADSGIHLIKFKLIFNQASCSYHRARNALA